MDLAKKSFCPCFSGQDIVFALICGETTLGAVLYEGQVQDVMEA